MKQIDEITLMAYADGELDSEDALEVEHALATDATLRAEVESYRRSTNLIQAAYGPIAKESCPTGILAAIKVLPNSVEPLVATKSWPERHWQPLAASIAAVAAIGALIIALQGPTPDDVETIVAMEPGERSVPDPTRPGLTGSAGKPAASSEPATIEEVIKIGAPAPDIAFTSVDGRAYRLSEFRGRPVMLWLFATWCRTCNAATVAVAENYDRLHQAGLQIIQLKMHGNLGYGGPTTKEFAQRYAGSRASAPGWTWGEASKAGSFAYNPNGYAEIYCLVDKDGVLRDVAQAPNVTMDKIMAFAESSNSVGGS